MFTAKGITFTEGDFTFSDEPLETMDWNNELDFPSDYYLDLPQVYVSSYNGTSEHVVIPSEVSYDGISYIVRHIGPEAFAHNNYNLKSVDLGSVVHIGRYAFGSCYNLSSIDLSQCKRIGSAAFSYAKFTSADLLSAEYIGNSAFYMCYNLTDIHINPTCSLMNAPFTSCRSLKNIEGLEKEGDLYFSSDTDKRVMFVSRDARNLDLRGFLVDVGALEYCSQLESLIADNIPNIASADNQWFNIFNGCNSLKEIKVYEPFGGMGGMSLPIVLPNGCRLYVPSGMADSYKEHWDLSIIDENGETRVLTDDDIIEFGLSIEYDSMGNVYQYKESEDGSYTVPLSTGAVLEDNFKIGIEPYSNAYIESVTLDGSDISSMLHDGIIDFSAEGITSGSVKIQFRRYPYIRLYVSGAGNSKIYDDGVLVNSWEDIIGDKEHCILIVPEEGRYVSEIGLTGGGLSTSLTLSEANTVLVTPDNEYRSLTVKFEKYPGVSVSTSGAGEVLYRGESLRRDDVDYVVNTGKELDFYIVPDENAVIDKVMWNDEDVTDRLDNRHLLVTAETRSMLSVGFVKSGYATLTVTAPGHHSVKTIYREGEAPAVTLTPVEGYTLHSLTLNGEPLEINDDKTFALPALYGDNELNAVYIESVESGINSQETSDIKITVFNHTISVDNKPDDVRVVVYDINGCIIAETCESILVVDDFYRFVVVRVGGRAYKVAL